MKIYFCASCGQSFKIPVGNYSRVVCPFCDSDKTALVVPVKASRHPLLVPLWVVAGCCLCVVLVVLVHVVLFVTFWGAVLSLIVN